MSTWQIRDKNTGEIIHTTTNADFVACINTDKFEVIKTKINENATPKEREG